MIRTALSAALAFAVSLILALPLLSGTAAAAVPLMAAPFSSGSMTLEIHKYEQPAVLGDPATGLPLDPAALPATDPVAGATFTATRVPGIDPTTNSGQLAASRLSVGDAATLVAGEPVAAAATTDAAGAATLGGLSAGLYFVTETVTPAGFVGAEAFLVSLPFTAPDTGDRWLSTVHVYPKNAKVGIALDVVDADAITLGDTVTWRAHADVPAQPRIDGYEVINILANGVMLESLDSVSVTLGGAAGTLKRGVDYTLEEVIVADGRQGFTTVFTETGRDKLALAATAGSRAQVEIAYPTRVTADGTFANEAVVLASQQQIEDYGAGSYGGITDTAETRWGPLSIKVTEKGNPSHVIPGATFKLYLTPEDARRGEHAIEVAGASEWVTGADGTITISGLRFSNFVNGLDRASDDPLFRNYYVMLTEIPASWSGGQTPIALTVDSATEAHLALVELWRDAGSSGSGGENSDSGGLPVTGGQLLGIVLLGALLVGAGVAVFIARRARKGRDQ